MPKTPSFQVIVAALAPMLLIAPAGADLLAPGGLAEDFATSLTDRPDLGGETEAQRVIPYSLADDQGAIFYVGQIAHDVVRNPEDGTLSFMYRVVNAPGSAPLGIENLITNSFSGYDTEVAILTDLGGETAPIDALRSDDGAEVTFAFDGASRIDPEGTSYSFLVKTNAITFDDQGTAAITAFTAESSDIGSLPVAGGGATLPTFRPTGQPVNVPSTPPPPVAVPLPSAALSAIPSLLGTAVYIRRFRRRQGHG